MSLGSLQVEIVGACDLFCTLLKFVRIVLQDMSGAHARVWASILVMTSPNLSKRYVRREAVVFLCERN